MNETAIVIREPHRPVRSLGILAALIFIAWLIFQVVINKGFQWATVGRYMLNPDVLQGVGMTVFLTILVMIIGMIIGTVLALMSLSGDAFLSGCAKAFVWAFRGTPAMVQLIFWYNLSALFPNIEIGIPFGGPKFFEVSATVAISSFTAALLGLGLNEGAYMGEIIRGGILSVDNGQREASKALGHRPWQTFVHVIAPQAMRSIVPPTGNLFIGTLKYTSLASVVSLPELMNSVEVIYSRTFETIPLLIVGSLWYLILVTILSLVQSRIEKHYSKGTGHARLK
jgi:polar amino acid transport system permease protein